MKFYKFIDNDFIRYFSLLGYLGFIIFINIYGAFLIYNYIANHFFKSLMLMIFLIVLGVFNGFYTIYKIIMNKK